jgi:hypothetical protein
VENSARDRLKKPLEMNTHDVQRSRTSKAYGIEDFGGILFDPYVLICFCPSYR